MADRKPRNTPIGALDRYEAAEERLRQEAFRQLPAFDRAMIRLRTTASWTLIAAIYFGLAFPAEIAWLFGH